MLHRGGQTGRGWKAARLYSGLAQKADEVLDSGKNKMVELMKVAFYPEQVTLTQTHVNVTKILTDQSGP